MNDVREQYEHMGYGFMCGYIDQRSGVPYEPLSWLATMPARYSEQYANGRDYAADKWPTLEIVVW